MLVYIRQAKLDLPSLIFWLGVRRRGGAVPSEADEMEMEAPTRQVGSYCTVVKLAPHPTPPQQRAVHPFYEVPFHLDYPQSSSTRQRLLLGLLPLYLGLS